MAAAKKLVAKKKKTSEDKWVIPEISKVPSVAIRQAIEDLTFVEKNPKYKVNMSVYHEPTGSKCSVCFAGAVLARAGNDSKGYLDPALFPTDIQGRLYGLDEFRRGNITEALAHFGVKQKDMPGIFGEYFSMMVTNYTPVKSKAFKTDMENIAKMLEVFKL